MTLNRFNCAHFPVQHREFLRHTVKTERLQSYSHPFPLPLFVDWTLENAVFIEGEPSNSHRVHTHGWGGCAVLLTLARWLWFLWRLGMSRLEVRAQLDVLSADWRGV